MENWGVWKVIKTGFWLGIGFVIPQLIATYAGVFATAWVMPSMMETSFEFHDSSDESGVPDSGTYSMPSFDRDFDVSKQIEIEKYRDRRNGQQLLILGSIVNNGSKPASSIQLEAELIDSEGEFVYECSEYINEQLQPEEQENFQITCGCGKNPVPEYSSINGRVVSASNF